MTLLVSSFEGGTAGTAVSAANSGGASGSAFDSVSVTGSGVSQFDSARAAHGGLANLIQCTSAVTSNGQSTWSASMGTKTQVWYRLYLYWPANGTNTQRVWKATSGSSLCSALAISSGGHVIALNAAGTTVLTSAATVPLGQWFRIEGFVKCGTSTGQLEFRLFTTDMDSGTADEVETSAASQALTASADGYVYGLQSNALVMSWWQDDIALSDTGYTGPVPLLASGALARRRPGAAGTAAQVITSSGGAARRRRGLAVAAAAVISSSGSAGLRRRGMAGTAAQALTASGGLARPAPGMAASAGPAHAAASSAAVTAGTSSAPAVTGQPEASTVTTAAGSMPAVSDG